MNGVFQKILWLLSVILVASVTQTASAQTISAPSLTYSDPNNFITLETFGSTPGISGFTGNVRAIVSTTSSGLVKLGTTANLSAPTGYNTSNWTSGAQEIGFEGAAESVNIAIGSLAYKGSGGTISLTVVPAGTYNPDNGSYYEYVASTETWTNARLSAASKTLNGLTGYLATVTTQAELDFIINKVGLGTPVWLGGTDGAVEGTWRWVDNGGVPQTEGNSVFFTDDSIANDAADFWCGSEPNNSGDEDALQINTQGCWNDLPFSSTLGYIVEYTSSAANPVGDTKEVTVVPYPVVTSASYDSGTNTLTVSGQNFVAETGPENDIDTARLKIGGGSSDEYTLSTSTNVEITSPTSFSIVLAGADISAVQALLDKNGSQSVLGTNYTLDFADDWLKGYYAAINIADNTALTVNGIVPPSAPTNVSYETALGKMIVAFSAPQSNGGSAVLDYEYQLDSGSWQSAQTVTSPIEIAGLQNGQTYSVSIRATNSSGAGAPSSSLSAILSSPATIFNDNLDEIRLQIQNTALQSIRNGVQEASGFMSSARDRFILCGDVSSGTSSATCPNKIPFDINGSASVSTSSANINGNFFGQFGNFDGTYRRMTSGDFNLQRDENGNTTGALSGRIAWEYLTSDTAMLGWFLGAEYIQSDMTGTFKGDQTSFGASIGGYFVTELQDQLYLDGHVTVKQNEHDLQITNGTLDLDSIYNSTSVLSGLTLTGVTTIDESSELWPTFSINAARTNLGTIGFTGTAYGLTDSTLSMDGGLVSYADVSIAPRYRAAMDGQTLANSLLVATVTPKAMCEYTELSSSTSRNCGTGLLLGLLGTTKDGNGTLELELGLDSIGGATRHSVALNADLRY